LLQRNKFSPETVQSYHVHENGNDKSVREANLVTSNNLIVKCTFSHLNILIMYIKWEDLQSS